MDHLPLLRTKLYRPRTSRDVVTRPRLSGLFDCNLALPLTLVCAPAGFGKTTLLNDWLENCSHPSAWVSLDENDSDLNVFLSYFIAAVRTLFPSACADSLGLLGASSSPPFSALVTALGNDLDALAEDGGAVAQVSGNGHRGREEGGRFILVLDDYHLLRGTAVHTFLAELLAHPPLTLHLIISTRKEPPLPLHRWRAGNAISEIRAKDLRFTEDEIADFMERALGTRPDTPVLETLVSRTEGWATGLRLAALSLSTGGNLADPTVPELTDDRYALGYLLNEVLARVPLATQEFLLKTSIVNRLSGPLCDALVGLGRDGAKGPGVAIPDQESLAWDGQAYLEWLTAQNVFTFALDLEGTWFRYHHLFHKLLRTQLERQYRPEEIAELHRLASEWLAENGLIDEAIEHALAKGDEPRAVELVERHRHAALDQEQWRQLELWLARFPRRLLDSQPGLLLLQGWVLQKQWRYDGLQPCLDRIESLLVAAPAGAGLVSLRAEFDTLRCVLAFYHGDAELTARLSERAVQTVPREYAFVRALAWFYRAGAAQLKGDVQGALATLHEGLQEDPLRRSLFPTQLYVGLCLVCWLTVALDDLCTVAEQIQGAADGRNLPEAVCWANYFRGCALYESNDLAGAEAAFSTVVSQRYIAHGYAYSQSAFGQASIRMARGNFGQARELVESVHTYALETENARIMADAEAFGAYLSARTGSLEPSWADRAGFDVGGPEPPLTAFVDARLLRVRALLALRTPASLARAAALLDHGRMLLKSTGNTRYLIEMLALRALLDDLNGDRAAAVAGLDQAVALAEPAGLIRIFVDLGPQMAALLRQVVARRGPSEYLRRVTAAFGEAAVPQPLTVNKQVPAKEHAGDVTLPERLHTWEENLVEPLSGRELEVLELLASWCTNKEIARELNIAPSTVKRHTVNIYQKLQVGGRRLAVARASALGLIEPHEPGFRYHASAN